MDLALPVGTQAFRRSPKRPMRQDDTGKANVAATQTLSDTVLVSRAADGDQLAFSELVSRHYRRALRVAYGMVKNRHDAEDITQEAFAKAYKRLPKFEGKSAFYTWLYRIITNLCIDRMRKKKRRKNVDNPNDAAHQNVQNGGQLWASYDHSSPENRRLRQDTIQRLRTAFEALPEIHQAVITLREIEGQSYEDIAQTLGLKKGTVMSRLFHARKAMQKALEEMELEEAARMGQDCPTNLPEQEGKGH